MKRGKIMTETISESVKEKHKRLIKLENFIRQCISCGDCREATDYSSDPPKWGICVSREHTAGLEPFFGRGKMQIARSIIDGKLELSKDLAEVIYQCPTCNGCSILCAYDMDNAAVYEALRAELVEAGFGLEAHEAMNQALVELLNPYKRDNKEKNKWLERLDFEIKNAGTEKADVLYFVGCTAALTPELQSVAINTARILKKLGVDFSVLGESEICCGSVALRTGNEKAFDSVLQKNLEVFQKTGVKTIITSCAGCFRTLKRDYGEKLKQLGINVLHSIQLIKQIIAEKNIPLKTLGFTVTYHDPCHAGRNSGTDPIYEEPRELLAKIAELKEMRSMKDHAKCCGAGGGVKKAFPELALEIAQSRVKEAEETGAQFLVSICPFCNRNLSDAIQSLGSTIRMADLMELLDQAIDFFIFFQEF